MLSAGSASAPTVTKVGVAGGRRGGGRGSCYRRTRNGETGIVGGSCNADRGGRLGPASVVFVDTFKIKIIDVTVRGGREGVVLLQLVRSGQEALEGGHGHGARQGGGL